MNENDDIRDVFTTAFDGLASPHITAASLRARETRDEPSPRQVQRRPLRVPRRRGVSARLLHLAGATPRDLTELPVERAQYVGIGAALLVFPILVAVADYVTMRFIVGWSMPSAAVCAVVIGAMTLSVERAVTIPVQRLQGASMVPQLGARIVFAICVGLVVTEPLLLHAFRSAVDGQVAVSRHEEGAKARLHVQRKWDDDIAQAISERKYYEDALHREMAGSGGAGVGRGPEAAVYSVGHRRAVERLNLLMRQRAFEMARAEAAVQERSRGFVERLEALDTMRKSSATVSLVTWLARLAVILVALLPMLLGLGVRRSVYARLVMIREQYLMREHQLKARAEVALYLGQEPDVAWLQPLREAIDEDIARQLAAAKAESLLDVVELHRMPVERCVARDVG